MSKNAATLAVATTVFVMGFLFLLVAHTEPSTTAIDGDLTTVRTQIQIADSDSQKYGDGLLKTMITLRREMLLTTEAMLEQKRTSMLRRINLEYVVQGEGPIQTNEGKLKQIQADIDKAQNGLIQSEQEAEKYRGGLLQAMALSAVETNRASIAQLNFAYYAAKYGMVPSFYKGHAAKEPPSPPELGKAVSDQDALK